jgi:hypothetical protein
MLSFLVARDRWAAASIAERRDLIYAVHGDTALADHDWAGLPPQAHAALQIAMGPDPVLEEAPEPEEEEHDEHPSRPPRKKR